MTTLKSVRIDDETWEEFKKVRDNFQNSYNMKITMSEFMRMAINKMIKEFGEN